MLPLLIRYRWAFAGFVAMHPVVYALLLILPVHVSEVAGLALVLAGIVLGAVWLVALILGL